MGIPKALTCCLSPGPMAVASCCKILRVCCTWRRYVWLLFILFCVIALKFYKCCKFLCYVPTFFYISHIKKIFQPCRQAYPLELSYSLTRILLESLSRPFRASGSSPTLAVTNLASEMIAAVSSRPSFLTFQFLSPILDTRSDVILSLRNRRWKILQHTQQKQNAQNYTEQVKA